MINTILKPFVQFLPENNRLEQIWVQSKTDFLKRYYGSALGVAWAFINPLIQFMVYYVVFAMVLENRTENFAMFLLLGIVLWTFFQEGSMQGLSLLRRKRYIIQNIPYKRRDFYLSSLLSVCYSFMFNFFVFVVFALIFGSTLHWEVIFFPILMFNLILLIVGAQLSLSVMNLIVMDTEHLWSKVLLVFFWISGIVMDLGASHTPVSKFLLNYNPFAGIIYNSRKVLISGEPMDYHLVLVDLLMGMVLFFIGVWINRKFFIKSLERL